MTSKRINNEILWLVSILLISTKSAILISVLLVML